MSNPIEGVLKFMNSGGFVMYFLVLCSIIMAAVIFERFYTYWKHSTDSQWMLDQMADFILQGKIAEALYFVRGIQGTLPRVFEIGLLRMSQPRQEIEEAMAASISEQNLFLDKNLGIIGTLAVISPFVGLFGTVLGIMRCFSDIALKGATGPAVVSKGVAEALVATAAGLFVAITAVIFNNYFKIRVKGMTSSMNVASSKLVEMIELYKAGKPFPEDLLPPYYAPQESAPSQAFQPAQQAQPYSDSASRRQEPVSAPAAPAARDPYLRRGVGGQKVYDPRQGVEVPRYADKPYEQGGGRDGYGGR